MTLVETTHRTTLVVGVGNLLLGDEGVGVHVARTLLGRGDALPVGVEVIEAGTAALDVLGEFCRFSRVIVVDAVRGGGAPGTVYRLEWPAEDTEREEPFDRLSLHQWDLIETLRSARVLGLDLRRLTLIGIEPATVEPSTELSPAVASAARRVVGMLIAGLETPPDGGRPGGSPQGGERLA